MAIQLISKPFYRSVYKVDVYTFTTVDNCIKDAGYLGVLTQSYLASTTLQILAKYILNYSNQIYMLGKSSEHFITVRGLKLTDAGSPTPFDHFQARHKFPFKMSNSNKKS